jgi:alkanesulfonate monooxygenase SsuD/methylene tetrahydromethanopterin reductase-like flavin-dependent oxidoreductase (luciferase family)
VGNAAQLGIFVPTGGINMMGGKNPRWDDVLAMTQLAEEVGLDFACILDHFEDYWEGWTTLAALAASTSKIQLISYVSCTTYRNPGLLAKMVDTVDEISKGRLLLGLGAGDSDSEHHVFGYPRDTPVARFEEAVSIIRPLLREGRIDHAGRFYTLRDCELRPRGPRPGGPPIIIGSLGGPRMLRLTVEHADIWSGATLLTANTAAGVAPLMARVDAACEAAGRDPATLQRMAEILVSFPDGRAETWTDMPPISGSTEEMAASLQEYIDLGFDYLNLWIEPNDISGIERFAPVIEALRQ